MKVLNLVALVLKGYSESKLLGKPKNNFDRCMTILSSGCKIEHLILIIQSTLIQVLEKQHFDHISKVLFGIGLI